MDRLDIKTWAEAKFQEHLKDIQHFISEGINAGKAFHMVMDRSTLGAGYKAQMRHELGLGIFD